jgi:membrane-associated phospholipid phosphatase
MTRAAVLVIAALLGQASHAAAVAVTATQPAASQPAAAGRLEPTTAPAPRPARSGDRLRVSWYVDLPVTGVLGLSVVTLEGLQSRLGPTRCRWCEPHLNGLDAAGRDARWESRGAAGTLSDVTAFGITPAVTLGLVTWDAYRDGDWRQAVADDLVIVEAAAAAVLVVDGIKYGAARKRPYVRELPPGTATGGDDNRSFPSGHTALAFSLATASGTVATMRGYRHAPWVWGAGMTLAAFTGYLRMAADKHYASDVVVGALVGSLVGWTVPYLLHRRWRR